MTQEENVEYGYITKKILSLPPGVYTIADLYSGYAASTPRVAKEFYINVKKGNIVGITLNGTRSRDGYVRH